MTIGDVQAVSVNACAHHKGMATASAVEQRVTPSCRDIVGTREAAVYFGQWQHVEVKCTKQL